MTDEQSSQGDADKANLSLTAIIQALDSGAPMPNAQESEPQAVFDPNATMNYQQAGVSYPEFPFVGAEETTPDNSPSYTKVELNTDSSTQDQNSTKTLKTSHAKTSSRRNPTGTTTQKPENACRSRKQAPSQTKRSLPKKAPAKTPLTFSSSPAKGVSNAKTRPARRILGSSDYDDSRSSFKPINTQKSSYKIRGGGNFSFRSPALLVVCALLVLAGLGILIYGLSTFFDAFSTTSPNSGVEVTTAETREAIDSRIPVLLDYVDTSIEDTTAAITESGQFLYANSSYQPDSPDIGAAGNELVSMPQEMSEEQLAAYYESSYSAYSIKELEQYFNGMYVLDMARGDLGSWNKLKYVNLNASSIEDEMAHLATLQGLVGDTVTVSAQGLDSRGNKVIQGQKAMDGNRVLYFKIAACPFSDIYSISTVSDASVYITCTLASYDFFTGSDTITAE